MNNQATYQNTRVQSYHHNVDILFSVVGGSKPPTLPLREERQSDGIELVFDAKGTGHDAVFKEKKRREEMLLEKLDRLEQKLARKSSYKRTQKRQKALKMVKELKQQLKNSASGISYQRYLDELRQMRRALKKAKSNDDSSSIQSQVSSSSGCTANIESKIMKALQCILDDSEIDIDNLDSDNGSEARSSIAHTADSTTNEASTNWDKNEDKRDDDIGSKDTKETIEKAPLETISVMPNSVLEKSILKRDSSQKSFGVRFKDVKPSVDDNIAKARELLNHARVVQRSVSNDSNNSNYDKAATAIDPVSPTKTTDENPSSETNIIRQVYSGKISLVGEKGRYHLFVSHACSWSHRCLVVRALKRLQDVVSISYVDCIWDPQPLWVDDAAVDIEKDKSFWLISGKNPDHDPIVDEFQRKHMSRQEAGTVRVPILWDKKQDKVVSSESSEIMKLLNFEFNQWSRRPKLNLFPAGFRQENDNINRWLHEKLYLGIYRSGLATTQSQYEKAIQDVTNTLDEADRIVQKRGFLAGKKLTESDVRLFVVLLRFDEVYRVLFKTNTRMVVNMPGLMEFVRDIYQVKGMKEVCDLECIKKEFYGAKGGTFIVPKGGKFMNALSNPSSI